MTNWAAFELLRENLITYFTGNMLVLALALVFLLIIVFVAIGFDIRYALAFVFPVIGAFVGSGWLTNLWFVNAIIIILGLFIGWVFIKIAT